MKRRQLIGSHRFRTSPQNPSDLCVLAENGVVVCGRPRAEHVEGVGEWMEPKHWFIPLLRDLATCRYCAYNFRHGVHFLTKAYRRLHGWKLVP